jgi:chaperonin GroEL
MEAQRKENSVMPKQILSGKEARQALLSGVNIVADAVKQTLGPRGKNVLLDRPGQPLATRDGVTVAKEVSFLPDPFENMGAQYVREVADAAVVEAGDGTTTATVILQAIVREGLKLVDAGAEPLLLADGIELAAKSCIEFINKMAIPATPELVKQAAIISTHGDVELGSLIAEATCKIGPTGVLELQDSRDFNTTVEHLEGFYFERGWHPYQGFVNDRTGQKCVLKTPLILISERTIVGSGFSQDGRAIAGDGIGAVAMIAAKERRPLVIVAEDLIGDALQFLMANKGKGTLDFCFVRLPGFGEQQAAAVEDLRIAVGARRVHSKTSTRTDDQLSSFTIDDLGFCEQASISRVRTVLIGGGANEMLKSKRIAQLSEQMAQSDNPLEKEQLNHRIARLFGGVAVLRVGAHSEPAMIEKKARAEDAIHACRGALENGIVPGGGVALLRAAEMGYEHDTDKGKGVGLLLHAIKEPALQIIRNGAYADVDGHVAAICRRSQNNYGFNSANGAFGDMLSMGIVDPCKVVTTALQKAASIGALLLTSEVLCCDIPEPKPQVQMPPHMRM